MADDPIQAALNAGRRDGQSAREKVADAVEQKAAAREAEAAQAEKTQPNTEVH